MFLVIEMSEFIQKFW